MQAISGSINVSFTSRETSSGSSVEGVDMASGLGFLALFTTQINTAFSGMKSGQNPADLLKGQVPDGQRDGKFFPQVLPLQPLFSGQQKPGEFIMDQFLTGENSQQLLESKLFSNIGSEVFSSQNFLDTLQGDVDTFTQSLLQELGSQALRGKGQQPAATGFAAITSQIGAQSWGDELISRIRWQIGQEIQEVKISLNPKELGPLQVNINISDNQAQVHFVTHHGQVRDVIENAIPQLREMMEQTGLVLADANVSQQPSDQGQTQSSEESFSASSEERANAGTDDEVDQGVKVIRAGIGLVDAFI